MKDDFFDSSQKRGVSAGTVVLIVLAAVLIAVLTVLAVLHADFRTNEASATIVTPVATAAPATTKAPETANVIDEQRETAFSRVFRENCDSVVVITTYITYNGEVTAYGGGSGFFVSEDGVVVTNNHLINGIESVRIKTYSGKEYDADILGSDERTEIAVLKIKEEARGGDTFRTVVCGDSDQVMTGEYALAIGCPMGYEYSLSVGIVSGLQRSIDSSVYRYKMIQIDTPINSGNSGGPLFNVRGEVIGVTTMKEQQTLTSAAVEGMGFAVPINTAMKVARQLLKTGKVTYAAIQATVGTVTDENNQPVGVRVAELVENGAAAKAGVMVDDVIVAFNGRSVTMINDLMEFLSECEPGQTVSLTVRRGDETLEINVILGSM